MVLDDGDFSHSPGPTPGPQVWVGRPGSKFSLAAAQPTGAAAAVEANTAQFAFFRRDPVTHNLDVILLSESVTDTTLLLSTQAPGGQWTDPAAFAVLPKSTSGIQDYGARDASVYNGQIVVGVQPTVLTSTHPRKILPGKFLLVQSTDGAAATTKPLGHSSPGDGGLRLTADPRNGHLHAAFQRINGKHSGLFTETRVGTKWSALTRLVAGKDAFTQALALTPHGQPVVGYSVD